MVGLDFILLLIVVAVAWSLMREGLWGACLIFIETLFAILLAFNFMAFLGGQIEKIEFLKGFAFFIPLTLVFCVALTGLRMLEMKICPELVRFPYMLHKGGGLFFGFLTGWFMAGFMLVAAQTVPLSPTLGFGYTPEGRAFFGAGIDRQCLGMMQHAVEATFDLSREEGAETRFTNSEESEQFIPYFYKKRQDTHAEWGGTRDDSED